MAAARVEKVLKKHTNKHIGEIICKNIVSETHTWHLAGGARLLTIVQRNLSRASTFLTADPEFHKSNKAQVHIKLMTQSNNSNVSLS